MANRKKLGQIRDSFKRIFALTEEQARSPEMVELRQQCLIRVCIWDGRFPDETLEDAVNIRQMDKAARKDNPHELANYLRRLKCVGDEKDDWSCIFYAFRHYVYGNENTKDLELANKLFGGKVMTEELPETTEQYEENTAETQANIEDARVTNEEIGEMQTDINNKSDVQEGAVDSLPHRAEEKQNNEEKESKTMANVTDIEKALAEAAGGTATETTTMKPEESTAVATTTGSSANSIDISSVGSANMAGVTRTVDAEWAQRQQWSADRQIVKVLCSGKPAPYKLMEYTGPNSNIMGELSQPADKVLEAIASTLYSVDQNKRKAGGKQLQKLHPVEGVKYIYNPDTKEVVIPECVRAAGQAAMDDFRTVIETLVQAGQTKPQFKVKITNSKPSITGVMVQVKDGKMEPYKLAQLRDAMVVNSKLDLEYANYNATDPVNKHSLLVATTVSKIDAKNLDNQGSYVKLVFGNRGAMFDKDTGDLTEYGAGIVDFVREITSEEDPNPRAVTSETGFQYKTADKKTRTYSLRVSAKTKQVRIVEAYQGIVGATAGGNVAKVDDESARNETIKLLNAITVKSPSSAIAQKVAELTMQGSTNADAALANQAVGGADSYES